MATDVGGVLAVEGVGEVEEEFVVVSGESPALDRDPAWLSRESRWVRARAAH